MLRLIAPRSRGRVIAWGLLLATAAALGVTRWIKASDHKDSALLAADHAADIADVYTFKSPVNPDNVVLVMTVSGFIPPAEASTTFFDPNVLYQWKIDNNGDAVEDLVIQAFVTGTGGHQVMHFRGPAAPAATGTTDRVVPGPETATVRVSNSEVPIVASRGVRAARLPLSGKCEIARGLPEPPAPPSLLWIWGCVTDLDFQRAGALSCR